jgi:hypothetical protein
MYGSGPDCARSHTTGAAQLAAACSELHILLADDILFDTPVLVVFNKLDSPVRHPAPYHLQH